MVYHQGRLRTSVSGSVRICEAVEGNDVAAALSEGEAMADFSVTLPTSADSARSLAPPNADRGTLTTLTV
jgi:hypothetical protein